MMSIRLRKFESLKYANPAGYLIKLRELEPSIAASQLPKKIRTLRTSELKPWRECREAALFCYFIGKRFGTEVLFARDEAEDYDFVATWERNGNRIFSPVQLKEVVPAYLNPRAELAKVISSLSKYIDSSDLTVAIHLNKTAQLHPSELQIPKLPLSSLWVFCAISPDATRWGLWGDLLGDPFGTEHDYPIA
jgi:hypothetical protein